MILLKQAILVLSLMISIDSARAAEQVYSTQLNYSGFTERFDFDHPADKYVLSELASDMFGKTSNCNINLYFNSSIFMTSDCTSNFRLERASTIVVGKMPNLVDLKIRLTSMVRDIGPVEEDLIATFESQSIVNGEKARIYKIEKESVVANFLSRLKAPSPSNLSEMKPKIINANDGTLTLLDSSSKHSLLITYPSIILSFEK